MLTLFFVSLFCLVYSYFVYPLALLFIKTSKEYSDSNVSSFSESPKLSLIITAFNEQDRIREKIENSLEIDYPEELIEIIVASDGSTDDTDIIVGEYPNKGVRLVRPDQRLGKEYAQLCAIKEAAGDVLVFSDVATKIPADAITKLSHYFNDKSVGAVSSEDRFIDSEGKTSGEGAYVKYEMWLRAKESRIAGLVGLSGSFFAVKKEVTAEWDTKAPSDFNSALNCAKLGLRAVTAPDVLGFYKDLSDPAKEYQRKVRTVLRGITGLMRHLEVLSVSRYGLFAFQVFSHKVMRWLIPWFMLSTFILNALVVEHSWFTMLTMLGQIAFYGLAVGAHFNERVRDNAIARLAYFFVQVNVAIADATIKYATGQRMFVWQPSNR